MNKVTARIFKWATLIIDYGLFHFIVGVWLWSIFQLGLGIYSTYVAFESGGDYARAFDELFLKMAFAAFATVSWAVNVWALHTIQVHVKRSREEAANASEERQQLLHVMRTNKQTNITLLGDVEISGTKKRVGDVSSSEVRITQRAASPEARLFPDKRVDRSTQGQRTGEAPANAQGATDPGSVAPAGAPYDGKTLKE